jgi:hypothetical protein
MPNRTWRPITLGLEGMSEPPIGEEEFELASDLDPEDGIPPESEEGTPPESDDPPDPSAPTGRPQ